MRNKDIDQIVLNSIKQVAPEAALDRLQAELPFREQFEFDSVDFLKFILKLQEETGGKISELDFPRLSSLEGCRNYLGASLSTDRAKLAPTDSKTPFTSPLPPQDCNETRRFGPRRSDAG
jgi:acyl carrier protein